MLVKDSAFGKEIDPKVAAVTSEYHGQTYYFYSEHSKKVFDKEPENYVNPDHDNEDH